MIIHDTVYIKAGTRVAIFVNGIDLTPTELRELLGMVRQNMRVTYTVIFDKQ